MNNDTTDTAWSASGMVEKMIPQIQLGLLQAWWKNDTTDTARSASGMEIFLEIDTEEWLRTKP